MNFKDTQSREEGFFGLKVREYCRNLKEEFWSEGKRGESEKGRREEENLKGRERGRGERERETERKTGKVGKILVR